MILKSAITTIAVVSMFFVVPAAAAPDLVQKAKELTDGIPVMDCFPADVPVVCAEIGGEWSCSTVSGANLCEFWTNGFHMGFPGVMGMSEWFHNGATCTILTGTVCFSEGAHVYYGAVAGTCYWAWAQTWDAYDQGWLCVGVA